MEQTEWQVLPRLLDETLRRCADKAGKVDAQRIFHGRGQRYPGLQWCCIDLFWPVLLISVFEPPPPTFLPRLNKIIRSYAIEHGLLSELTVVLQSRFADGCSTHCLMGELPQTGMAVRGELSFAIRFDRQNTGFFLDMEPGRRWLERRASQNRVLNLFSYTCAFSVVAMAAGAHSVVNVDMSKGSLQRGRENHLLNDIKTDAVEFMPLNILKSWSRIRKKGPFDIIVVDPPSFQKGSFIATRDYHKVIKRLDELSAPGCEALLCLNAPELNPGFLHGLMNTHASDWQFVDLVALDDVFLNAEPDRQLKLLHYVKS